MVVVAARDTRVTVRSREAAMRERKVPTVSGGGGGGGIGPDERELLGMLGCGVRELLAMVGWGGWGRFGCLVKRLGRELPALIVVYI